MRGEREAVAFRVRLQEGEVVLDRLGGQGEDRGGEAAGEEVAAFGGQGADGQAVRVGRECLEAVVDPFVGKSGEFGESSRGDRVVGGQGSLLKK